MAIKLVLNCLGKYRSLCVDRVMVGYPWVWPKGCAFGYIALIHELLILSYFHQSVMSHVKVTVPVRGPRDVLNVPTGMSRLMRKDVKVRQ